jgi:phenylalanyl-tRNA synthetase beta subunit
MSAGLDVASGVAGLISLSITAFQGCVKGLQLIAAAKLMEQDQERIRCIIQWEQYRLVEWGQRIGVTSNGTHDPSLNWAMAAEILKQLEVLLTDTNRLKTQYGLIPELHGKGEIIESTLGPRRGITRLWKYVGPEVNAIHTRIVQETATALKRLKWVSFDHEKFGDLVKQISTYANTLIC